MPREVSAAEPQGGLIKGWVVGYIVSRIPSPHASWPQTHRADMRKLAGRLLRKNSDPAIVESNYPNVVLVRDGMKWFDASKF